VIDTLFLQRTIKLLPQSAPPSTKAVIISYTYKQGFAAKINSTSI